MDIRGKKISFNNEIYTILNRKRQKNKPPFYLFCIPKKKFLSSLYTIEEGRVYQFDDRSKVYLLRFFENGDYEVLEKN